MSSPLLWATRPSHQNGAWQQQLAELGEVVAIPLLDIIPVSDDDGRQAIKNRIVDLDHYQHVIFVSQNAVAYAFEWINNYWPQLPMGVTFYAIGAKTAEAARHFCDDVSECGDAMNSEDLLQIPSLQQVEHHKVLICRGRGGRPKLADELEKRGAYVHYCELYERQLPLNAKTACAHLNNQRRHIVPVFSGETLSNLLLALPSQFDKSTLHLIVPAQHIAQTALNTGFSHVAVAQNASEAAMLASTRQMLNDTVD